MRTALFPALLLASQAAAAEPVSMDVDQLVTADELAGLLADKTDAMARSVLWTGPNFDVRTLARTVPGEVEVHDRFSDIFIVLEGEADMLLGGSASEGRITEPGEHRGGTIAGGRIRHIAPGDLLWIPAGMPHQASAISDRFRYIVIKIAQPD